MADLEISVTLDRDYSNVSTSIEEIGFGALDEFEGRFQLSVGNINYTSERFPLMSVCEYFDFFYRVIQGPETEHTLTSNSEPILHCIKRGNALSFFRYLSDLTEYNRSEGLIDVDIFEFLSKSISLARDVFYLPLPRVVSDWIVLQHWRSLWKPGVTVELR